MPPVTKLPRPAGHINISYSPMSPANWGIVAAQFHVFVYRDARVALQALLQAATTIHAQRLEAGTASLFSDYIYFRGQADISHRLLPTRLRGTRRESEPRERYGVPGGSPGNDPRDHFGDWHEDIPGMREVEDSVAELSSDELRRRDQLESADVARATHLPSISRLGDFQRRAAVRHYSHAPSSILDLTTNPEVAAFFATGGGHKPSAPDRIGMLWAIDLNFLAGIFKLEISSIPDGYRIRMRETRQDWGDNKKMFEDQGILPACMEITSVALPFKRPLAQHARFLSLSGEDGKPLPLVTEMTWWSIIERRSFMVGFLHNGQTYQAADHNITESALLPKNDELAVALA